ncbi:MAG: sporulation protein YabP [Clostridia bacterium]|nr:sporulation protein YabP [Clostridia bacterium]
MKTTNRSHNIIMENRKTLSVSGVSDVDSFDEQTIVIHTGMGELTVKGTELHIERLSTDAGELTVNGNIYGLMYTDDREKNGFWAKLFR